MKNPNNWRRFSPQLLGFVEKIKKIGKSHPTKSCFCRVLLGGLGKLEKGGGGGGAPLGAGWWRGASGNEGVPLEMRGCLWK